jgi:hypothetical protein
LYVIYSFVINHITASKFEYLGAVMANKSEVQDKIMKNVVKWKIMIVISSKTINILSAFQIVYNI